jgi:hypothetical protein
MVRTVVCYLSCARIVELHAVHVWIVAIVLALQGNCEEFFFLSSRAYESSIRMAILALLVVEVVCFREVLE